MVEPCTCFVGGGDTVVEPFKVRTQDLLVLLCFHCVWIPFCYLGNRDSDTVYPGTMKWKWTGAGHTFSWVHS